MKMLIDGKKLDASDGGVIEIYEPASGKLLDTVPKATKADAQACLAAAQKAKAGWAARSMRERAAILLKCNEAVAAHKEELATLIARDSGKLYGQCVYEMDSAIRLMQDYVEYAKHMIGRSYQDMDAPAGFGSFAFTVKDPLGVVLCIAPFNYPIETLVFKLAPALLMGNAVIVKPPTDCPVCVLRFIEVLHEAGLPAEVCQCITGRGSELGDWLVDTPLVDAVSFTGSTAVGAHIAEKSAPYLHRLLLELGGNDAVIVFEDANVDAMLADSMLRLWNAGQTCCGTKRYLIHNSRRAEVVAKLAAYLPGVKCGDPLDPASHMGSMISEKAAKNAERQIAEAVAAGAKLVCGGQRNGAFLTPAVLDGITKDMAIAKDEECFAPIFSIIGFDTEEEAIEIANASSFGLNAGVVTADMNRAFRVAMKMQAGTVVTNSVSQWRTNEAPFGGYKMSGWGKECLEYSLDEMSQQKTVVVKGIRP